MDTITELDNDVRKAHWLKPITSKSKPSRVIFVDTETSQTETNRITNRHELRLGIAKSCRTRDNETLKLQSELMFYKHNEFWDWLIPKLRPNIKIYIVSHNLNYDLPILKAFSSMANAGWSIEGEYTNGMITIIRYKKYFPSNILHDLYIESSGEFGKKPPISKVIFLDNTNLFAGKLATWGDYLKLPKLPVDFEGEDEQLITYCNRDVDIMLELWRKWFLFLDEHIGGKFGFTISSTAMNAFRSRFQSQWIHIHGNRNILRLERQAYKGGRSEALYRGKITNQKLFMVDINSMYPYIMSNKLFPTKATGYVENVDLSQLDYFLKYKLIIADVDITTPLPLFPYRVSSSDNIKNLNKITMQDNLLNKFKGKTCYPVGSFRTTLTTPELKAVYQFGTINKIHSLAHYTSGKHFTDYVNYFYKLRLKFGDEGQDLWKQLCKLLLNSLYGKFGQRGYDEKIIGIADTPTYTIKSIYDATDDVYIDEITIDGLLMERRRGGEHWNSFPAIAAHVTAYARLYLYRFVLMAGVKNVLYMDTDSLLLNLEGYTRLEKELHPTELGKLKLEKVVNYGLIHAPKDYQLPGKIARKGIKKTAKLLDNGAWQQEHWPKLKGLRRSGKLEVYETILVEKHLTRFLWSGVVYSSGRVYPFRLALR